MTCDPMSPRGQLVRAIPCWNSLVVQWAGLHAFLAETWVQSLVRKPGSCKLHSTVKKKKSITPCLPAKLSKVKLPPTHQDGYYQKTENNKCWQGCGEIGRFVYRGWGCKMVQLLWKTVLNFLKKKSYIDMIQQLCFWGFVPGGSESRNNG